MDDDIRWATQSVTVTICHNFVIGSRRVGGKLGLKTYWLIEVCSATEQRRLAEPRVSWRLT